MTDAPSPIAGRAAGRSARAGAAAGVSATISPRRACRCRRAGGAGRGDLRGDLRASVHARRPAGVPRRKSRRRSVCQDPGGSALRAVDRRRRCGPRHRLCAGRPVRVAACRCAAGGRRAEAPVRPCGHPERRHRPRADGCGNGVAAARRSAHAVAVGVVGESRRAALLRALRLRLRRRIRVHRRAPSATASSCACAGRLGAATGAGGHRLSGTIR